MPLWSMRPMGSLNRWLVGVTVPLAVVVQQCGFFLSSGDGDAKVFVLLHAQRHGGVVFQDLGNVGVRERFRFDVVHIRGLVFREELDSTDTIAADMPQQIKAAIGSGTKALLNAVTDWLTVGKQVVEVIFDDLAGINLVGQRHGQGESSSRGTVQPSVGIAAFQSAAGSAGELAHFFAVHENEQL